MPTKRVAGAVAVLALFSGCSGEIVSPAASGAKTENPIVSARIRPWGDMMAQQRRVIAGLEATSKLSVSNRLRSQSDSEITKLQRALSRLQQDSIAAIGRFRAALDKSTLKPNFTWAGSSGVGG